MIVYEYIHLTKKRVNSKKWSITSRIITTDILPALNEPKAKTCVYRYLNCESVEQVKAFLADNDLVVMSPLGMKAALPTYDMHTLLMESAACTHRCSVTGKKVIVCHYAKEEQSQNV